MKNSVITFPLPANEPVKTYLVGSPERAALEEELERQRNMVVDTLVMAAILGAMALLGSVAVVAMTSRSRKQEEIGRAHV